MTDNIVIEFNNVSKKFKKGRKLFLKQALLDIFKPRRQEEFFALSNVSLKTYKGEAVGIIGNNGSGKSTLLKLIAGVSIPTDGKVAVKGKIGPLIELGAGFHLELTGRENIYLSGTILGLAKKEIDKEIKNIINFSGLEDFIDTPVKHYSSGMYMRLGFSIVIHVAPEILLIDEILAVGDVPFQQKCLEKIKQFHQAGATIVLVSHSMELIKSFCQRVYFLQNGTIRASGNPERVVNIYLKSNT